MDQGQLNWIANFIWGIADDVLRDLYVRGKYRDVILPMTVLRRLDAVLEPTKQAVLDMKASLDKAGIMDQRLALQQAAGQSFYNTSKFTLRDLRARASQQQLKADFEAYLDGFSPNVQEILDNFKLRNQIPDLVKDDALGFLIEKFLDPAINLSPNPVNNADGSVRLPGLDNHAMGTIFEELVRRFNEENNEEAGEHWTPRDAVKLMAKLIFLPIADEIESGTYLIYDGACGTGGMLTVAEETLQQLARKHGKQVSTHLYGQEINPETYAICKADLLLKGEGEAADNMVGGAGCSTLSNDAFPSREFDFMLSNPPYGKSWKKDLERMGGKESIKDSRFLTEHAGNPEYSLITRSSDGQMLFLANLLAKMKRGSKLGSRIAEVHNGSSLFTGDAGQGESNIRRWIIENDWLEAIVALPLNMFYNTGIATYIWVLTNHKAEHRKGKVQLIDATQWFRSLPRNLGKKNCELSDADIQRVLGHYLAEPKNGDECKWFDNADFGYWKITVERPLRLRSQLRRSAIESLRFASGDETLRAEIYGKYGEALYEQFGKLKPEIEARLMVDEADEVEDDDVEEESKRTKKVVPEKRRKKLLDPATWLRDRDLVDFATLARQELGDGVFEDHNEFRKRFDAVMKLYDKKVGAAERKATFKAVSWRDENAPPVVAKRTKLQASELFEPGFDGRYLITEGEDRYAVEYEPDTDLRDTEQVPLKESGGIEAFFQREVLPHAPDAWIAIDGTKIGYEVIFARYFYRPKPLRTLEEIRAEILALEHKTEGLLLKVVEA